MFRIEKVPLKIAGPFIERWHYSKQVPTGKNIYLGWYIGEELYAVADYGIGVNPYQASYLARISGFPVTNGNLLELKRLCRTEPKVENAPLTKFLAGCHKLLAKEGYRYVVSFSDPAWGHNGGIYKAANFKHLGQTQAEIHLIDSEGKARHRRYPYRYAKRNGITIQEARDILNVTRVETLPKDRWFISIK